MKLSGRFKGKGVLSVWPSGMAKRRSRLCICPPYVETKWRWWTPQRRSGSFRSSRYNSGWASFFHSSIVNLMRLARALTTDACYQTGLTTAPIGPQRRIFIPGWVLSPCPSCSGPATILDCVSLGDVRLHERDFLRRSGVSTRERCLDVDGQPGMHLSSRP
jgi:hypothetical protein